MRLNQYIIKIKCNYLKMDANVDAMFRFSSVGVVYIGVGGVATSNYCLTLSR